MRLRTLCLALPAVLAAACTDDPAPAQNDAGVTDTAVVDAAPDAPSMDAAVEDVPPKPDVPPDYLRAPDLPRPSTDEALATQRASCTFGPGAWAAETLGSDVPIGDQMPIDHILVVIQENRSFDHYFRDLPNAGVTDVEVASDDWSNPRADGSRVTFHRDTERCIEDVEHGWNAVHRQYNDGAMDGFVTTNDPMGDRALTEFTREDLPFYYSLASTFAIADHYHCSVLGPTWPNRFYFMAATSFGLAQNIFVAQDTRTSPVSHIFSRLDDAGVTWKDYAGGPRMLGFFPYYGILRRETQRHFARIDDLLGDIRGGTLPAVSIIEPDYLGAGGDRVDEHPPGTPQQGERFVESIVRALMASPVWRRSALFITYDEHGGFADHVPPPPACEPDALTPTLNGMPAQGRFDRLGVRVPFIVVSPYARRHFVSHRVFDHTSITRFIEARFGLPALTKRDANASIPTDMFDFASPPFMTPPTLAPGAGLDDATRTRCNAAFPSAGGL